MEHAKAEVLRYLGHRGQELSPALAEMVSDCMEAIRASAPPRHVRATFALDWRGGTSCLPAAELTLPGADIARHLNGCTQVILLAATLGAPADGLIRHWETADLTRSLVLDACATQYIEETCDAVEAEVRQEAKTQNLSITTRYSPGYGDFPLELQPRLLAILDANRRIGLTCTGRFLMLPRKSVTAIIGLGKDLQARPTGCAACARRDTCTVTKGTNTCEYTRTDAK